MRGFRRVVVVGGCVAALTAPGTPASGAETLGLASGGVGCDQSSAYVQLAGGPNYTASSSGVITEWSAMGDAVTNRRVSLLVLRPVPGVPGSFMSLVEDGPRALSKPGEVNEFRGRHVPINAGDLIGRYSTTSTNCGGPTGIPSDSVGQAEDPGPPPLGASLAYDPYLANSTLNIAAIVEPDADADLWGDDSQDECLGAAGTAEYFGCPNAIRVGKVRFQGRRRVLIPVTVPGAGGLDASAVKQSLKQFLGKDPIGGDSIAIDKRVRHRVTLELILRPWVPELVERRGKLRLRVHVRYSPANAIVRRTISFVLRD